MSGEVRVGLRVVRGPDWQWRDQDGGEGHVGTIVELGRDGSSSSPAKTVVVQWDSGSRTNYRCGYGGKHDLRLLDNSTLGLSHKHVTCDVCKRTHYYGIRWKCCVCDNYDLCHSCYRNNKHEVKHRFWRIDVPGAPRVEVPARKGGVSVVASGIFPGARVVRGADWQWDNQDGGAGSVGVVEEIRGWNDESDASVASVNWATTGSGNVYRVGHQGKVDLKYVKAARSDSYYPDHLPVISFDGPVATGCSGTESGEVLMGDLVRVSLDLDVWQALQEGHGGWSNSMVAAIGDVGEVLQFNDKGDVIVRFQRQKQEWRIHPAALTKVVRVKKGDYVRMIEDVDEIKALLIGHGEWVDDMQQFANKVGRVMSIMPNHDIRVRFGMQIWTFHPSCVRKVADSPGDDMPAGSGEESSVEDLLVRFLAGLEPGIALAKAVQEGDLDQVRIAIGENPDHLNDRVGERKHTSVQIAAHLGLVEVIEMLFNSGADITLEDDDGDGAIHYAVHGEEAAAIEKLAELGADVNMCNHKAETPLHVAVNRGHEPSVRALLDRGASVLMQDAVGDTPLHDAIAREHDEIVNILLQNGADMTIQNYRGFAAMHQAALKGSPFVMEKLVNHAPHLVNVPKEDGFTPLHLAAFNNHVGAATVLLQQSGCNVDSRNLEQKTPLMLAVCRGFTGSVELLISYGADLDAVDRDGDTVLHMATLRLAMAKFIQDSSQGGSESNSPVLDQIRQHMNLDNPDHNTGAAVACFLAQEGCSLKARNHRGQTPLDMLAANGQVRELIEQYSKPKGWSGFHGSNRQRPGGAAPVPRPSNLPDDMGVIETTEELGNCMLCDGKANMQCNPCGHRVVCVDCGRNSTRCGRCKAEAVERLMVVVSVECLLCSNRAVVEFRPCGHVVTCKVCSASAQKCPKCKDPIAEKWFEGKPMEQAPAVTSVASPNTQDPANVSLNDGLPEAACCPICLETQKEVAFLCGHRTCAACSRKVFECPICRKAITHRITLF